jgi:hypothetical protein
MRARTIALTIVVIAAPLLLPAQAATGSWSEVARILQSPEVATGGYHRYNFPRRDVTLQVGDVTVSPMLALGGWAGFSGKPASAMMMGDLVVLASELKPALAELARQRLSATAIHNHLAGERPSITYIHFHGDGEASDLARRLDRVIAVTAAPRPVTTTSPAAVTIDTALVFRTMGTSGRAAGNVAQLSYMLIKGAVTMHGKPLVPALAVGSPVNVQMVDSKRAVATGDFAVSEAYVEPVVNALATHGITATAVHSHLVGETPRVYYIHFWADGALPDVLTGLKAAVDAAR